MTTVEQAAEILSRWFQPRWGPSTSKERALKTAQALANAGLLIGERRTIEILNVPTDADRAVLDAADEFYAFGHPGRSKPYWAAGLVTGGCDCALCIAVRARRETQQVDPDDPTGKWRGVIIASDLSTHIDNCDCPLHVRARREANP